MVERAREDLRGLGTADFTEYVLEGGLRVGRTFVGLSEDEIAAQLMEGGAGGETILLDVVEAADTGTLTFLSRGSGEGGGGMSYEQTTVYLCWSIEVDLGAGTTSDPENSECSEGVVRYVHSADLISL